MQRAIFIGFNALGDTLCTTPTIRAFRAANPDAHITYVVQSATFTRLLDHNPDIDFVLYSEFLSLHGMTQYSKEWLYTLPLDFTVPSTLYYFDINQVCTNWDAFQEHISVGFSKLVKIPIESPRPVVNVTAEEKALAASFVREPYAVLSMHSNANPERKDKQGNVKDWPLERWQELCRRLRSFGIRDVIAVGSEFDTRHAAEEWRNLYGLPIKVVAALLEGAACVVTLENGVGHLAHGVDAPMVMIYSDIVPLGWANPVAATHCRVLYGDTHQTSVDEVTESCQKVMDKANTLTRVEEAISG